MRLLKFNKHYRCYNAGEIAGFEDPFAEGLIGSGIATLVVDTPGIAKDIPAVETASAPAGPVLEDEIEGDGEEKTGGRRTKRAKE